jgi:hypothetical protein
MNSSLYHKFLDISIIPAGLNIIEANKPLMILLVEYSYIWYIVLRQQICIRILEYLGFN